MLASLPTEAIQPIQPGQGMVTPGVQDLFGAFKNGFITVDDIQKRLADRPVEESNRQLNLQANEFKSKRMAEQEQLAPANLALESHRQALTEQKYKALEKDLNADEDNRPAKEAYEKAKINLEANLVSPEPKVRREAYKVRDNLALESVFSQTFGGDVPEYVELPAPAKPQDFQTWAARNKSKFVDEQEAVMLQQFPQATPDTILAGRVRAEEQFDAQAHEQYREYARQVPFQKSYAYQGTPDYYKELNRQLTERAQGLATQGAQFDAYKTGLQTAAKTAAEAPTKVFEGAAKLRQEIDTSKPIQKFREQQDAAGLVETFATLPQPTNRSDLQLVYAAVKLADPGSVVREGEIALSKQADPVLKSLEKKWQGLFSDSGKLLDAADRAELLRISKTVQAQAAQNIRPELEKYRGLAAQQGIPLKDILNSREASILGAVAPAATASNPYEALVGKTVVDKKTGRRGVVTKNPDGTYTIK